jgi:hypothetical protein
MNNKPFFRVLLPLDEAEMRQAYNYAFGKEFDCNTRRQIPLPLELAYKVAIQKLEKSYNIKYFLK